MPYISMISCIRRYGDMSAKKGRCITSIHSKYTLDSHTPHEYDSLYRDPWLIAAQLLSIVGVVLSLIGFYWTWLASLTSAVLLGSAVCCSVGKVTFYIAICFALGAAGGQIFVMMDPTEFVDACWIGSNNQGGDGDDKDEEGDNGCDETLYRGIGAFGLAVWILVSVMVLYFVIARHDKLMEKLDAELQVAVRASLGQPPRGTIVGGPRQPVVPLQTTRTVTILADGSKQIESSTYNSDGSITVNVTMEPGA